MAESKRVTAGDSGYGSQRRVVLILVTHPMSLQILMRGQLEELQRQGLNVVVACGSGRELEEVRRTSRVEIHEITALRRDISPIYDLAALVQIVAVMLRVRPIVANCSTPKAGLLGVLAARITKVPTVVYTVRGLRLETLRGVRARVLRFTEKTACHFAHRVICVSASLRDRLIELGLSQASKAVVLGAGSSNGVNVGRFRPRSAGEIRGLRIRLGLGEDERVVGFVGRVARDKGAEDLEEAFRQIIRPAVQDARLLIVGEDDPTDPPSPRVLERLEADDRILRTRFVADPADMYAVMDVLAFPSYREGFPNVPLEASASGVPIVAYGATGTVDVVDDAKTGILVPVGDWRALGAAVCQYLSDPDLRRAHGEAGRDRVEADFRRKKVWNRWVRFYKSAI